MNPFRIINKYHKLSSQEYLILVTHSVLVANKALVIARELKNNPKKAALGAKLGLFKKQEARNLSFDFVYEAAALHDIGFGFSKIDKLAMPKEILNCYMAHGWWGSEILKKEGLKRHARVALSHIGVGLTKKEIEKEKWPIPAEDYFPENLEEMIISYADLFFSKSFKQGKVWELFFEETKDEIKREIKGYGDADLKLKIFEKWDKVLG
ncbi:MAG: HD domain-containing protein [Patescibacteria group bacterium]|nr:HD domain-containing protein [Patescibacteria group bacterium]